MADSTLALRQVSAPALPTATPDCARAIAQQMSLKDLASQVIMVGTPVNNPASIHDVTQRYHLGGVFLAGRSTQSAAELRRAIEQLQAAGAGRNGMRLLIAIDQEGGDVQTLRGGDFPAISSAVQQGQLPAAVLHSQTVRWAGKLAAVGITLNLAPVADTVPARLGEKNPPIGAFDRQYGSDPQEVAGNIAVVVSAMQSAGLQATLKHFPGLGRVLENTDTSIGAIDHTVDVGDSYLAPFVGGIRAGSAAIMISSARYPKLDPSNIAVFSKTIITGLLREELNFQGLIVSDDLGEATAIRSIPPGRRAIKFIHAGGSLVLTVKKSDVAQMVAALVASAESTEVFRLRLREAATTVLRSKESAGLLLCPGGRSSPEERPKSALSDRNLSS